MVGLSENWVNLDIKITIVLNNHDDKENNSYLEISFQLCFQSPDPKMMPFHVLYILSEMYMKCYFHGKQTEQLRHTSQLKCSTYLQ